MAKQISEHEVRIYQAAFEDGGWLTSREIGVKADVADRTTRHHAKGLAKLGVFEVAKVFGGFRYRIKTSPAGPAAEYVAQIEAAKDVL